MLLSNTQVSFLQFDLLLLDSYFLHNDVRSSYLKESIRNSKVFNIHVVLIFQIFQTDFFYMTILCLCSCSIVELLRGTFLPLVSRSLSHQRWLLVNNPSLCFKNNCFWCWNSFYQALKYPLHGLRHIFFDGLLEWEILFWMLYFTVKSGLGDWF